MENNYDPRMDFYRKAIDFLFKQTPVVVFCTIMCVVLWNEMNRRDNANESKISLLNNQWSEALNIAREDWRMCEEKRQKLEIEIAKLTVRFDRMERRNKSN